MGTPGRLWGWRESLSLGFRGWHSRETLGHSSLWFGRSRTFEGDSGVGHSRETLRMGTPGVCWRWALKGVFWGWAFQTVSGVGHSRESRPGEEKSSERGEELSLKSNNPTPETPKTPNAPEAPNPKP